MSGRVTGACRAQCLGKRMLKQSLPLTVQQVRLLEAVVLSEDTHVADRIAAGQFLSAYSPLQGSAILNVCRPLRWTSTSKAEVSWRGVRLATRP